MDREALVAKCQTQLSNWAEMNWYYTYLNEHNLRKPNTANAIVIFVYTTAQFLKQIDIVLWNWLHYDLLFHSCFIYDKLF